MLGRDPLQQLVGGLLDVRVAAAARIEAVGVGTPRRGVHILIRERFRPMLRQTVQVDAADDESFSRFLSL
jgi:hypothetical protein